MGYLDKNNNLAEIYSEFKACGLKISLDDLYIIDNNFIDLDLIDNNSANANINTVIKTIIKVSKITDFDFDKIFKPYMRNKQT